MNHEDNWGCPDWKIATAYPKNPDELQDWEWRWQFLRRSPEYRKLWEAASTNYRDPDVRSLGFDHVFDHWLKYGLKDGLLNPRHETLGPDNPFSNDFAKRIELPPEERLAPFGYNIGIVRWLKKRLHIPKTEKEAQSPSDGFVLFSFDISRSIRSQIESVQAQLMTLQGKHFPEVEQFKKLRSNWSRHLRVIDAKDQGASHAEIADKFVEDGWTEVTTVYKRTGTLKTQHARHKAIVSGWIKDAKRVMVKAARLL